MTTTLDSFLDAYSDEFAYAFDNAVILNWYPQRIIENVPATARVLELGVGHGVTSDWFARHFEQYEVIDGSAAVIEAFRKGYPDSTAILHEGYFEDFALDGMFDLIVMGFVLEHVEDPALVLRRYRQYLKPGGRIAVAVPNGASLHRRFGHAAGLLDDMMALGAGDKALGHMRVFTTQTLARILEESGYRMTRREGIFLKPFTTEQMKSLSLSTEILQGMCEVGRDYPELCAALLFEAEAA